jgi:1-acyl-sn-glycerol-3-phosphate acyltransferase
METESTRTVCMGLTQAGRPCKNLAVPGSAYCRVHQPGPGPEPASPPVLAADCHAPGSVNGGAAQAPEGEANQTFTSPAPSSQPAAAEDTFDPGVQSRLAVELESLIQRVLKAVVGYTAPPFSASRLVELLRENLEKLSPDMAVGAIERLRTTISEDLLNIETWKGIWFILNYSLDMQAGWLKRRLLGDYQTDDWGLDWDFLEAVRPFFEFMYNVYWRVETSGLEYVPATGRGLLVANHSGQVPWDGVMLGTAILTEHPSQRLLRNLYATWFPTLPFVSAILVKLGQTLASADNGTRLLDQGELVGVFPEGYRGIGKLYRERYRLARFGRGGFVRMAIRTGAPIIPVSVVGAEETYIALAKSPALAKLTGFPYFPISPTWPWLGLFGLIPLPTKWYIDIGEPIPTDGFGPEAAENTALVSQLSDQVRNAVQQQIYVRLAQRRSVFFG